jgi:asparagine synthetase B (glutamine-hydrolysing)
MDKNVMQASVEARVPFLEPAVAELVLNLPLAARVGPWSKGILRDVARRLLPWQIAHRPKIHGMAFDGASWIEQEADPTFLRDGLLRDSVAPSHRHFDVTHAMADWRLRLRLWSAEVWCRSALGGQSISDIEQALWR